MDAKICAQCKILKWDDNFINRHSRDGKDARCKSCLSHNSSIYAKTPRGILGRKKSEAIRKKDKFHRTWAKNTIYHHKQRGYKINFSLDELEILALKTLNCFYCQVTLEWSPHHGKGSIFNSPSLDRIDNETFLNLNNVTICCYRCNTTKGARTLEQLIWWCKTIIKNHISSLPDTL